MSANLTRVEEAKREIDKLLAAKRQKPGTEEKALESQIAALKAKEQEAETRLSVATARVVELEERIKTAREERSLAQFLHERTRSDDYRQYLGLISTIRRDFEGLVTRLMSTDKDDVAFRPVDRIILYIDDLDRCPEAKVMEVLQAVHLLLAYPLFVVVVGVDPRWLLNSLLDTFKAFRKEADLERASDESWNTMPQNYIEKIFQIPFTLRPMTSTGYGKLISNLLVQIKREQGDAPRRWL